MPAIPAQGVERQENLMFEASLGYKEKFCLKKKQ
jgi:hypothetical protein